MKQMNEHLPPIGADEPLSFPFTDWSGPGPAAHIAHANGFPPSAYRRFAGCMKAGGVRPLSMFFRPLWPGEEIPEGFCWDLFADDLTAFLEARSSAPAVAVGHSLGGAVSVIAAARRPDLFSAVVCIDPVIVPPWLSVVWRLACSLGLSDGFRLSRMALKRRTHWESREQVLETYGGKYPFDRWAPGVLEDYLADGLREANDSVHPAGGVELAYSTAWEAKVFSTYASGLWKESISRLTMPILVVRGEKSDTFLPAAFARMRRVLPHGRFIEVEGADHFLPMTHPEKTARLVLDFLGDLKLV